MDHIADYELVLSLGSGTDGELYLAVPPARLGLDTELVALKAVFDVDDSADVQRISTELRAYAAVHSDQLAALHDAGQDGSTFFYAMEWSLLGTLARPTQTPNGPEIVRAIAGAAHAAHALHEGGVLHRGITPGRVLMAPDGGKLVDLGLSELLASTHPLAGARDAAAIGYVDPSVLRGETASRATDIWALGASWHRARTGVGIHGELPASPTEAIDVVLATDPQLDPSLPADEAAVLQRCFAPIGARFATADELANALDELD